MFSPVDYGEVNLCFSVNDLREYVPFCSGFIMFTCNHCDHLSFAFVCFFVFFFIKIAIIQFNYCMYM